MTTCSEDSDNAGDSSLDFLSGEFDPLRALQASPAKVALPCPTVQACDNLDMYESITKGTRKVYTAPEKGAEPVKAEVGVAKITPTTKRRAPNTVLHFMQEPHVGPFSLLQRCLGNGTRVRVWTRHCAGVRGVCEGVLLAFDKHFNMVLGDVCEEYSPFKTLANGGAIGKRKRVRNKKASTAIAQSAQTHSQLSHVMPASMQVTCTTVTTDHVTSDSGHVTLEKSHVTSDEPKRERLSRTVKQLFIRGDNVVMVTLKDS